MISNAATAHVAESTFGRAAAFNYPPESAPDYIAETVEPSEATWERVQELYRKKEQEN